jgi:hypothetical protein
VNYLGNKTTHIWGADDINPSLYIPGSSAPTNQRRILYLQNPSEGQYFGSITQADDGGNSHYNGLLTSIQHRFANNFTLLTNYTWSHCISDVDFQQELATPIYQNPFSRRAERGSCLFDHRHIFNTSLAIGTGHGIGNLFSRKLTTVWQVSPIISLNSGSPMTVTDGGRDISLSDQLQDRPNVVLPNNVYPAQRTTAAWFNTAAFATQPAGTFGNEGRDALIGPGTISWDMAFTRDFPLREHYRLNFRADFFNIMNHANWNNPILSNTSAQFGQITTFGSPRIIQAAMKLFF